MANVQEYDEVYVDDEYDLIRQIISDWIFFSPSPELTILILGQNDKLGSDYFRKHWPTVAGPAEDHSKNLLSGLQKAFDILFHKSDQKESQPPPDTEIISDFQAFFSERIFNHLAMLSRTSYAKNGTYSIKEELTIELAEKIGLGLYLHEKTSPELRDETEKVLLQLAGEFQSWFVNEHQGIFRTVWGSMLSVDKKDLRAGIPGNSIILVPDVEDL